MKNKIRLPFIFLFVLLISSATFFGFDKVIEKSFNAKNLTLLRVGNVNGSIVVQGENTKEISITVIVSGKEDEVKKLKVNFSIFGDKLKVNTDFPKKSSNLKANFNIKVPNYFNLKLSTVNGQIKIDNISGELNLKTINGTIEGEINTLNGGFFSTVNGKVKIAVKKFEKNTSIKSINGNLKILVSDVLNLRVIAKSVNGSIKINHKGFTKVESGGNSVFSIPLPPRKKIALGKNPKVNLKLYVINGTITVED